MRAKYVLWLQPSRWQDSDDDQEVVKAGAEATEVPKQERKREDLAVANGGGPEADQTKPAKATEVPKQERKGEDFVVANRGGQKVFLTIIARSQLHHPAPRVHCLQPVLGKMIQRRLKQTKAQQSRLE